MFPSTSPNSESVRIEITDQGLKFVAPENIQALNIKIPEIDQVELKNPVILTDNITSIINKNEGLSIAVASTSNLIGDDFDVVCRAADLYAARFIDPCGTCLHRALL